MAATAPPGPAAEAPASAPEAAPVVEAPTTAEPAVAVPTKKELTDKFILLAQERDRTVAIALLGKFGAANLPELKDKSKWALFIAEIDKLLEAK